MKTKKELGNRGEQIATDFLFKLNYDIVCRNFKIREGEIDIIAWHKKSFLGDTLCFIEVKTRQGEIGSAERAVDKIKINKMLKTAKIFCLKNNIDSSNIPIQFEEISIYIKNEKDYKIFHYEIPF